MYLYLTKQNCAHKMSKSKINMIGMVFGRYTVISEAQKPLNSTQSGIFWNCVCSCGNERVVYGNSLRHKKSKSCGCLRSEVNSELMKNTMASIHGSIEDRFLSKINRDNDNGCWEWTSSRDKNGYGSLSVKGKTERAHRYSYEYHIGKIPVGYMVCHKCDNAGCVNPDHLFLGAAKDNIQDMLSKDRDAIIGERNNKAKLSQLQVLEIRKSQLSVSDLVKLYGVSKSTIYSIRRCNTWSHLK